MGKKITLQQIADRLGVSKYTVSQALSGKGGIGETTRMRVLETARAMGYRVPPVSSGKSKLKTAAMKVSAKEAVTTENAPTKANPKLAAPYLLVWISAAHQVEPTFWSKVLTGIETACSEQDIGHCILIVSGHKGSKLEIPSELDTSACVGHVLAGTFSTNAILTLQRTMELPIVLLDHEEPLAELDSVLNANVDAALAVCRRLLAGGCKRIVFVGCDTYSVSFKERFWGCRKAAEEAAAKGETFSFRKWSIPYNDRGWIEHCGQKIAALSPDQRPDGFICANDDIALELLRMLGQTGLNVPEDCKVVGFDNIEAAAAAQPPLTTVELAKEMLGVRAVETLLYRIARPGRLNEKIALSFLLVPRESG